MKTKLQYVKYSIFHPFDGFYQTRFRGQGSFGIAVIILLIFGILQCLSYQYTGFVMNTNELAYMNSIAILISSMGIIVLISVSNWTISTLFNGKGDVKNIFIVICYSMIPNLITSTIVIFTSNFVIEEEVMILRVIQVLGYVWTAFMLLAGLCVIHEYTLGKNLISLVATVIAALIIIFLGVLFITLVEQMISFFSTAGEELLRRL